MLRNDKGLSETATPFNVNRNYLQSFRLFFDREGYMAKGKTSIFSASPADTNRPNGWGSVRDVRNGIHL